MPRTLARRLPRSSKVSIPANAGRASVLSPTNSPVAETSPRRRKTRTADRPAVRQASRRTRPDLFVDSGPIASEEALKKIAERLIEVVPHASYEKHPESAEVLAYETAFDIDAERQKGGGAGKIPQGVPAYVAGLYEIPLLGKEREAEYFLKMNYLKWKAHSLRSRLRPGVSTDSDLRRIEEYLSKALVVRNEIIRANLRLVVSIAKKYANAWVGFDELVSEGNLPLMRAVELFDVSKGFRFSTYATWAIRNHLQRYVADRSKLKSRFIAGGGDEFVGTVAAPDWDPTATSDSRIPRLREVFSRFFERLTDRERSIVELRYGLSDRAEPLALSEIGRHLGISKERVRQLALSAVEKMRKMVAGEWTGMALFADA